MLLQLAATLHYRFDAPCEVLLLLEAARSFDQHVIEDSLTFSHSQDGVRRDDPETGERRVVFDAEGDLRITYDARVEVAPRITDLVNARASALREIPQDVLPYLRQSRYCPSDRFESFSERQFGRLSGGVKVQAMLDWILSHLDYRPGSSHAGTTALDTFTDRAGVCRDFSHLAISLCRAAEIPARMVSGFAWGLKPADMHAIVEVWLDGRWILLDPTGRAPTDGFVRVATGRDAADIAFMTIFGRARMLEQSFSIDRIDG